MGLTDSSNDESVRPEAVLTHLIVLSARVNVCILYQGFWTGTSCTAQAALICVPLTGNPALARIWPHVQYGTAPTIPCANPVSTFLRAARSLIAICRLRMPPKSPPAKPTTFDNNFASLESSVLLLYSCYSWYFSIAIFVLSRLYSA